MIDIPHFAQPFTRDTVTGSVAVVEQDTVEHIMSCEEVIVRCPQGFRAERPEFGWPFPEFRTGALDLAELETALAEYEPRGNAAAQQWTETADAAIRHIQINVEVEPS